MAISRLDTQTETQLQSGLEAQQEVYPVPPPDRNLPDMLDRARKAAEPPKSMLIRVLTSRRFHLVLVLAVSIAASVAIPWYFWNIAAELPMKITVVDKTVPFKDYREHKALYWLLIQNKFIDPTVQASERWYEFDQDYIGVNPVNPPQELNETFLTIPGLQDTDVVYFTDTYGVYSLDYRQFEGDKAATKHSAMLAGGMTADEIAALEWFTSQGRTVIAEFNTFASPSEDELRARMEKIFGVTWTHWIGRYFVNFEDETDVPYWLYEIYRKQAGKEWDLKGSGYMLCRYEENEFIILQDDDLTPAGLVFQPLGAYAEEDVMRGVRPSTFSYWFDIVEPAEGTELLASYEWHLSQKGVEKLRQHGLSLSFPAVVRKQSNYTAYYMAGEMMDFNKPMGSPDTRLTMYINRSFYGRAVAGSTGYTFWHSTYPLISNILRRESNMLSGKPERIYLFR